jgi:hypothetical protein
MLKNVDPFVTPFIDPLCFADPRKALEVETCQRGDLCAFAHSREEVERERSGRWESTESTRRARVAQNSHCRCFAGAAADMLQTPLDTLCFRAEITLCLC